MNEEEKLNALYASFEKLSTLKRELTIRKTHPHRWHSKRRTLLFSGITPFLMIVIEFTANMNNNGKAAARVKTAALI